MKTVLALLLMMTLAHAADEPRLINFNAVLQLPEGGDITECLKQTEGANPTCLEKTGVTLGMVCYRALLKPKPNATLPEAMARWRLSQKVSKGPVQLAAQDIATLVNAIHDFAGFSTEIEGQSICLIDPVVCKE